ncbi:L7Ae/L30e/S12e/Gadd45 family ribosomal protein [Phosphitispora sp. TUW77]|uniref:L7Ae/L30e/S12e/Gadd45 family ribosomal protein n=1 Tax=Phosphitispora sp. TUW77 TaxID=3152361 RepID=UPI003AB3564D
MRKGYDFLGLAQRAGKAQSGETAAEAMIKKEKARLVILARDASDKTKRHFTVMACSHKIKCIEAGEKMLLGMALGRSPRSVVVITDDNFASRLHQLFGEEEESF